MSNICQTKNKVKNVVIRFDENKTTPKDVSIKVDQDIIWRCYLTYHQSQSVIDCVYSLIILRMFCANIIRSYHIHCHVHDTLPFTKYSIHVIHLINPLMLSFYFSLKIILFKYIEALIAAHKCMLYPINCYQT